MTGNDKTEDQLLSSIRKNKPAAAPTARKTTARKTTPRRTAATKPKPKPVAESIGGSAYRSGRRVWPD
jgi:hypothetical protein